MGKYVTTAVTIGKAQWIKEKLTGTLELPVPPTPSELLVYARDGMVPVCVVQNGLFDAAGVCDTADELEAFTVPADTRPRTWLVVPRALIAPFVFPPL